MALTLTLAADRKRIAFSGPLAAGSCEALSVVPATVSGTVRLLDAAGVELGSCEVTDGAGTFATSDPLLLALFSGMPPSYTVPLEAELCDADGYKLGRGRVWVENHSCASSPAASAGGVLAPDAGEEIPAGAPVMIVEGLARICTAGNASGFVGIAASGAALGAACRIEVPGRRVTVPGWGLTPGAAYYLPQSGDALTASLTGVNIVRMVGIATDTSTLLLAESLAVQAGASGTASYLVWDPSAKRLVALAAATEGGGAAAGKIAALDASGVFDKSLLPSVTSEAVAAVRGLFADISALENPTDTELLATVNQLIARLKGDA